MESSEAAKDQDLLEKLKSIKSTVRRNFQDMVNLLTSVISLSSPYLGGHLRRVAETGKAMADLIEIPKEESYGVYYAGLLHDIGLLGLPESLLTTPGGLNTEEAAETYRTHSQTAADIVNTVYDLRRVGGLIRSHHEDYNGQGFPDGLKGKDISPGARILRIVNDYDRYLYVDGLSVSQTMDTLFSGGGQLYDPEILERFGSYIRSQGLAEQGETREITAAELREGQFLHTDLFLKNGMILMPRGVSLNSTKMAKIHSFSSLIAPHQKIVVTG